MDLNSTTQVGRVATEPLFKYAANGAAMLEFNLVNNRRYKKEGAWKTEACFMNVILFGKLAESISEYVKKGDEVGVVGRLNYSEWEDNGQKKSRIRIIADQVRLGSKKLSDGSANGYH